jgi:hypothetical protein
VVDQLHAPAALTPGKSPRYPLDKKLGRPQPVWTLWRKVLPLQGIEQAVQPADQGWPSS